VVTTNFTDDVTVVPASWLDDVDTAAYSLLTSPAGTNTITATGPASMGAYASGQIFRFLPANTNTGATTINITPSGGSALGAKSIFWNGVACVGDEIRQNIPCLIVYDGTQFHIIGNGFNAPFLDSHPVVVGDTDRTKKVRIEADGITTGTTRVITVRDADFSIGAATQAEQESGSSVVVSVTPGRQQFHPSAAKGWGYWQNNGTLNSSYNITSIADSGTGVHGVVWATDLSASTAGSVVCGGELNAADTGSLVIVYVDSYIDATTTNLQARRVSDAAQTDPGSGWMAVLFGDQ